MWQRGLGACEPSSLVPWSVLQLLGDPFILGNSFDAWEAQTWLGRLGTSWER